GGIDHGSPGIADGCGEDTGNLSKVCLHPPETSGSKSRFRHKILSPFYSYLTSLTQDWFPTLAKAQGGIGIINAYFGSTIDPRNRMAFVCPSTMAQTNGWSRTIWKRFLGSRGRAVGWISTEVAAAASVPSSDTSRKVLCFTCEISRLGAIPERSA